MTLRLVLSPKASRDVDDIWNFSARTWSVAQADQHIDGLRDLLKLLCDTPGLARLRRDIEPPIRLFPCRSHVIIFRSDPPMLDVLRLLHADGLARPDAGVKIVRAFQHGQHDTIRLRSR